MALLAVYVTLTLRSSSRSQSGLYALVNEDTIIPLSVRAAVVSLGLLLIRCMFIRSGWPGLISVLALGLAKSCLWYSLILTVSVLFRKHSK
jgi:uncharacterized membrane protein